MSGHRDGDPGMWGRRGPKHGPVDGPAALEAGERDPDLQPLPVQRVNCVYINFSRHGNHPIRRIIVHKSGEREGRTATHQAGPCCLEAQITG